MNMKNKILIFFLGVVAGAAIQKIQLPDCMF